MQHTFLEQNPFYILEVSPEDKRALIISKAEEKAFFMDGNECEEAQAKLLNPEKRLYAEIDWFFNLTIEKSSEIYNCISNGTEIINDGLQGVTRLNAVLFNFSLASYEDYFELGYAILELDELYSGIDQGELLRTINAAHQKAGIRDVSEEELAHAFGNKRTQIRQLISEKIATLSEEDLIEFITMLAEKCVADEEYDDGIIISDVVDQYEVRIQSLIEEATESIFGFIEETKTLPNYAITESRISELIQRVKQWDRLVQPLQLKSMASGITHGSSQDVGREIHEFTVWLHNERDLSGFAISILDAMKPIFAEIGDLATVFESDKVTLTNIIKNNKEAEQLVAVMEALKRLANSIMVYATNANVNELIAKVKAINKMVKRIDLEDDLVIQVRENVCYIARDVAITLHNDRHQTAHALTIAKALVVEFNDIPSLKTKLAKDVTTLDQQIILQAKIEEQQQAQEDADKAKRRGCFAVVGILLLIFLIVGLSRCDSCGPSNSLKPPSDYSNDNGYQSNSAKTYTVTLNKQDGAGGTSSVTVKYGNSMPYATAPSKSGYTFGGYYSSTNGSGTKYYDSNMRSVRSWDKSSNTTLYAYWISNNSTSASKITLTASNFEDYFTITTSAEYVGNKVTISYSIKPKSSAYASHSLSSSSITLKLKGGVYLYSFSTTPTSSNSASITLNKSSGYKSSGTITITVSTNNDEIYWGTEVTSCSGTLGK